MVTVLKCRHCKKTFMIDLEVEKINPVLLETCPECLSKTQRGEPLPDEEIQQDQSKEKTPVAWFT